MRLYFILFSFLLSFAVQLSAATSMSESIYNWGDSCQKKFNIDNPIYIEKIKKSSNKSQIEIHFNTLAADALFRETMIKTLYHEADSIVKKHLQNYQVLLFADKKELSFFVPNYFRKKQKYDTSRLSNYEKDNHPFKKNISRPFEIEKGMSNINLALWHSHGMYYNQQQDRWQWQRAHLFTTIEDKLTRHYLLNYLLPMLENAGASVFMPVERDTQIHEVIVDNDSIAGNSYYQEVKSNAWHRGGSSGFAAKKDIYNDGENPFASGTYCVSKTKEHTKNKVIWVPDIPQSGYYSVSVSYHASPENTPEAHYTVHHTGGETTFSVNQQIGGTTWIYLGTFYFEQGLNKETGSVELSAQSNYSGTNITADAVRFGGGIGNVARRPAANEHIDKYNRTYNKKLPYSSFSKKENADISHVPRYLEASRYFLQWSGFPQGIYNETDGVNDYLDDLFARGLWVNYMLNGSYLMPDSVGLNIPIDLAIGLHTDAGVKANDSIVGSLGLFMTKENNETFYSGQSRYASRDLCDLVLTEIAQTVKKQYHTEWPLRGIRNRSYIEARLPQVPTILLELLSHQNPTDMRYALDPNFQFSVSRAIYKAILKFLSVQKNKIYIVQPLPVQGVSCRFENDNRVRLSWHSTTDSLTKGGAKPTGFVVYTGFENTGFDNGILTRDSSMIIDIDENKLYNFKITAVNDGGESFPSETVSVCKTEKAKNTVLIVNGFNRVSAPAFIETETHAGFYMQNDAGIPYKETIHYSGSQYDFDRNSMWQNDDLPGFGASQCVFDKQKIAGNSFDYPQVHGKAIRNAGFSFVSCSRQAVESGDVKLTDYNIVDVIMGLQKRYFIGIDSTNIQYVVFTDAMRKALVDFKNNRGALFISGAFIGSDLTTKEEKDFAQTCLSYKIQSNNASQNGIIKKCFSPIVMLSDTLSLQMQPSSEQYHLLTMDGIISIGEAFPILRYSDSGINAAIASTQNGNTIVASFPFETIIDTQQRYRLMLDILTFLTTNK